VSQQSEKILFQQSKKILLGFRAEQRIQAAHIGSGDQCSLRVLKGRN
jgi:hypothetical protein